MLIAHRPEEGRRVGDSDPPAPEARVEATLQRKNDARFRVGVHTLAATREIDTAAKPEAACVAVQLQCCRAAARKSARL